VNPYLGLAASLACGLLGLRSATPPRPEFKGDAYSSGEEIPRSLYDALDLFNRSEPLKEILGEDFARVYMAVKLNENKEFLQVISPWEREHLLLNV
jgi:glutamine synthetase